MSLPELFRTYLVDKGASSITAKNYVADIKRFVRWFESSFESAFEPKKLTPDVIKLFTQAKAETLNANYQILDTGISQRSFERYLSSLRKFAKFLTEEKLVDADPFEIINHQSSIINHPDPWFIKDFKDYLYVFGSSSLTIKNYLVDIRAFTGWAERALELDQNTPGSRPGGSNNNIEHITSALAEEYKERLINVLGMSPKTVNRKLSSIRKYLQFAQEQGHINQLQISPSASLRASNFKFQIQKKAELSLDELKEPENNQQSTVNNQYSPFPPARLIQRLFIPYFIFEDKIASRIAAFIRTRRLSIRAFRLSKLRTTNYELRTTRNYPKGMYAPHEISLKNYSWHQKIIHHARYTRPNWYKRYHNYSFVHYFHFAVLVIYASAVGFLIYTALFSEPKGRLALAAPTAPPRILSFQGRLTDLTDTPITTATDIRFQIYDHVTATGAGNLLWQEVVEVSPDQDGIFSELLGNGSTCAGQPLTVQQTRCAIPSSVFTDNATLYLGITIENTAELTPRQQLATVAYAANSESLQGMLPITDAAVADNVNTVLALDSSGNLTMDGATAPTFQATGAQFKLSGQPLLLTTNTGSNGNVVINPDGLGKVDIQKPLLNTSATGNITPGGVEINDKFGVLATESAVAAFIVNNNTTGGDIFTASSSGTRRFTIGNDGTLTSAIYTAQNGVLYGTQTTGVIAQATTPSTNLCLLSGASNPSWGTCPGGSSSIDTFWNQTAGALYPNNSTVDLLVGGQATASAKFAFINVNSGNPTATISGNLSLVTPTGNAPATQLNILNNGSLDIQTSVGGDAGLATILRVKDKGVQIGGTNNSLTGTNASLAVGSGNSISAGSGGAAVGNSNTITAALDAFAVGFSNTVSGVGRSVALGRNNTVGGQNAAAIGLNNVISADNDLTFGQSLAASASGSIIIGSGANISNKLVNNISDSLMIGFNSDIPTFYVGSAGGSGTIGKVGIGTTSPLVMFDVRGSSGTTAAASISAKTSFAGMLIDNNGVGPIFTASTGGVMKFTVENNGQLTFSNYRLNGGVFYADTSGTLLQTTVGSNGQCLQSVGGGAPTWSTCGSGSNWDVLNGTISPKIASVLDLLIGGQATTSAKFAIKNVNGSLTPIATLSATTASGGSGSGLVLNASGSIQSLLNGTLTIGGNTTGNILLAPLNDFGTVGIGLSIPTRNANVAPGLLDPKFQVFSNLGTTPVASFSGKTSAAAVIVDNDGVGDLFTASSSGVPVFKIKNNGDVVIGSTGLGKLTVGVLDPYLIENTGTLFSTLTFKNASTGGADDFLFKVGSTDLIKIMESGDIIPQQAGLDVGSVANPFDYLYSNNIVSTGTISGFWQRNSGALAPYNITDDLLLGATSTASAKFSVINIAGGTPVASIAGNFVLGSDSGTTRTIGATAQNNLQLGDANTGGIALAPDGTTALYAQTGGNVGIGTTSPTQKLHLSGGVLRIAGGGANGQGEINLDSGTEFDGFQIRKGTTSRWDLKSVTAGNDIHIATDNGTDGGVTQLYLKTGGNVGINTTNPTAKLDVAGDASTSGSLVFNGSNKSIDILNGSRLDFQTSPGGDAVLTARMTILNDGNVGIGTTSPATLLQVGNSASTTSQYLTIDAAAAQQAALQFSSAGGEKWVLYRPGSSNDLRLYDNADRVTFQAGGNVGIGTTGPDQKLDVLSGGGGTQLRLTSTDGSVYTDFKTDQIGDLTITPSGGDATISGSLDVREGAIFRNAFSGSAPASAIASNAAEFLLSSNSLVTIGESVEGNANPQVVLYRTASGSRSGRASRIYSPDSLGTLQLDIGSNGDLPYGAELYNTIMTLKSTGNVGIGDTSPASMLTVGPGDLFQVNSSGAITASTGVTLTSGAINLGGSNGTSVQCLIGGTTAAWGSCSAGGTDSPFQVLSGAIVPLNSTLDFLIGGQATLSAKFAVLNINSGTPVASVAGNFSLGSAAGTTRTIGATAQNNLQLGDADTGGIALAPDGTTALYTQTGGNVGIGTTAPSTLLQVAGTIYNSGASGTSIGFGNGANGLIWDSSNGPFLGSTANFVLNLDSNNDDADTRYFAIAKNANTFTGGTELFRITEAGNVGIGTTGPDQRLDVLSPAGGTQLRLTSTDGSVYTDFKTNQEGDLNITPSGTEATISGRLYATYNTGGGSSFFDAQTIFSPSTTADTYGARVTLMRSSLETTGFGSIGFWDTGNIGRLIVGSSGGGGEVGLSTGSHTGSEVLLSGTGNFGVGTTSPISELHVTRALSSAVTGKALAIFDQIENQDIFTASASGSPIFSITNAGGIKLGASVGTGSQCITGGATAAWGTCGSGGADTIDVFWNQTSGLLYPNNSTVDLAIGGQASTSAKFLFANVNSGTPTFKVFSSDSAQSLNLSHDGTNGNITASTGTINIGAGGGTLYVETDIINDTTNNTGYVKIADKLLVQNSESAGNALAVFDNTGAGDILTASATGVTKFVVNSTGNLQFTGNSSFLNTLTSAVTGAAKTWTLPNATGTICISGDTCGTSGTIGYWNQTTAGTLFPGNSTVDLLVGGTATASAKFSVLGIAAGTNPTASVSATLGAGAGNGIVLAGDGSIQSLRMNTLTLGGGTTGYIVIDSGSNRVTFNDQDIRIPAGTIITDPGSLSLSVGGDTDISSTFKPITDNQYGLGNSLLAWSILYTYGIASRTGVDFYLDSGGTKIDVLDTLNFSGVATDIITGTNQDLVIMPNGTGKVGINTTSPTAVLDVNGTASISGALKLYGTETIQSTAMQTLTLGGDTTGNIVLSPLNGFGSVGINTSSPLAALDLVSNLGTLPAASISAKTSFAGLLVDNRGVGDIFTASTGGVPKFTIKNNGQITSSNYRLAGGVFFADSTGLLLQTAVGTGSQCLLGGTTPAFGACSTGTVDPYWQQSSLGALFPNNSTVDLLIGGQATASAKFAVLGIAAGTNPTASVSATTGGNAGNGIVIAGDGSIQSLRNNTLTIGGNTTGNIVLTSDFDSAVLIGSAANVRAPLSVSGGIGSNAGFIVNRVGTTDDIIAASAAGTTRFRVQNTGELVFSDNGSTFFGILDLATLTTGNKTYTFPNLTGTVCISGDTCATSGTLGYWNQTTVGTLFPGNSTVDLLVGGTATASAKFSVLGIAAGTNPTASVSATLGAGAGNGIVIAGDGSIQSLRNNTLTIGGNTTGNIILSPLNNFGSVGINTSSPLAALDLVSNLGTLPAASISAKTSFAGLLVDNRGVGDIFTASTGGVPKFTIKNNGQITSSNYRLAGGVFFADSTGLLLQTAVGTGSQCLLGGTTPSFGACGSSGSSNWTLDTTLGVLRPNNNTVDLLVGGTASNAAKFAVLNINSGTPVASVSSGLNGTSMYMTADGTLATQKRMSLTIGNSSTYNTTGNTLINPNGIGLLGIGTTTPLSFVHIAGGNFGGNAALILDQLGATTNDILTASAAGLTKLRILNDGTIRAPALYDIDNISYFLDPAATVVSLQLAGDASASGSLVFDGTNKSIDILNGSRLDFQTSLGGDAGLAVKMTIQNNGNVGIGTALAPTNSLPWSDPKFQVFSNLGTAPVASFSGKTSAPALFVTNEGTGDYIVASAAGVRKFKVANNGDLYVGNYDGTSGTGKIFTSGFDPLYTIDGKKYSTYGVSMLGMKEEYTGKAVLSYNSSEGGYAHVLDFNTFEQQSDLWVFSRIISPDLSTLSVLITPNSQARTWYRKDPSTRRLIFYADRPTEVSYRLTADRFDIKNWPTISNENTDYTGIIAPPAPPPVGNGTPDGEDTFFAGLNIVLRNGAYELVDSFGNVVHRVDGFSKLMAANLVAGLVQAQRITTNSLTVTADNVDIAGQSLRDYITSIVNDAISNSQFLISNQFSNLNAQKIISPLAEIDEVRTNIISPLGSDTVEIAGDINVEGNATFSGSLNAENVNASSSSFLSSNIQNLTSNNATISGTLYADKIQANSIEGLEAKIASFAAQSVLSSTYQVSSPSGNFDLAALLNNQQSIIYNQFLDIQSISSDFGTFREGLIAFGPSTFQQVSVLDGLSIGSTFIIGSSSIDTLGQDLNIQPLKQGAVSFLAGAIRIETDGTLKVAGNAEFAGDVSVGGKLTTNVISPLPDRDLAIHNSSDSAILAINQTGDLTSSGSGTFNKLNLSFSAPAYATSDTTATATSSAGTGILKRYRTELTISNPLLTNKSLIYITPVGNTNSQVLYLLRQTPENTNVPGVEGSFTVGVGAPAISDIKFNWIIVN